MKEVNDQFYGFSYELDEPTTETDGTTCYAVDNGKVYVAFSGIWYEQPVFWAAPSSGGGGGGGASLPSVSAADNGDVLTVVEGAWAKAEPSGAVVKIVTVTYTPGGSATADATYAEIESAINNGQSVRCQLYDSSSQMYNGDGVLQLYGTGDAAMAAGYLFYPDVHTGDQRVLACATIVINSSGATVTSTFASPQVKF